MVLEVTGDEDAALRVVAVRQREAEARGGAERGGDAGHDVDRHAGFDEDVHFFAAAPEDEGIAALETHDGLAFQRLAHEQLADVVLRHRVVAGHLADEDALGGRRDQVEDAGADQIVIDDDFGRLQQTRAFQRDQFGIAWAGADESDVADRVISGRRGGLGHDGSPGAFNPSRPPLVRGGEEWSALSAWIWFFTRRFRSRPFPPRYRAVRRARQRCSPRASGALSPVRPASNR